jgi:hypothetical protein
MEKLLESPTMPTQWQNSPPLNAQGESDNRREDAAEARRVRDEQEKLEVLERIIARNLNDLARTREAADIEKIIRLAASWMTVLQDVPNRFVENGDAKAHILEVLYAMHTRDTSVDITFPVNALALRQQYNRYAMQEAAKRERERAEREARESIVRAEDKAPLSPQEMEERRKITEKMRERLAWSHEEYERLRRENRQREEAARRPTEIRGALKKKEVREYSQAETESVPMMETPEQTMERLGFDLDACKDFEAVQHYYEFHAAWQKRNGALRIERVDLEAEFARRG